MTEQTWIVTAVAALDSDQRAKLTRALATAAAAHHTTTILDTVEQVMRDVTPPGRTAIGVLFTTGDYGTGHVLTDQGTALFDDGTTEDYDFFALDELFAELYGRIGETFTLAVDLRTDTLDPQADYPGSIHRRFSVLPPPAPPRTVQQILCGTLTTDLDTTDAELEALAAHIREHGPNGTLSINIRDRFPQAYAAALQQHTPSISARHNEQDPSH